VNSTYLTQKGNVEEAKRLFNKVLELDIQYMKSITEKCRESTADALHYLGKIAFDAGDLQKSLELLEKSWMVYRYCLGIRHLRVAYLILDLAQVKFDLGGRQTNLTPLDSLVRLLPS
jgi:tetratricopeptide (TPR) repeat protein